MSVLNARAHGQTQPNEITIACESTLIYRTRVVSSLQFCRGHQARPAHNLILLAGRPRMFLSFFMMFRNSPYIVYSEGKRHAEPTEGLETTEQKKVKLDPEVDQVVIPTEGDSIEIDDALTGDAIISPPEKDDTEVVTIAATTTSAAVAQTSKQKSGIKTKGPDIHFKENPYTFLSPDDPVLQACMYELPHDRPVAMCD